MKSFILNATKIGFALGALTKTTLKVSKDNVIFGVEALDREGHAGLPVIPVPSR
jgi:hypothetical protein